MTEEATPDDLITIDEAARMLGVSRQTVYRHIQLGTVRGWRVGFLRRIWVSRKSVEAFTVPTPIDR